MRVHVILPAAGLGTRMQVPGVAAKQFLQLGGIPVLVHSVRAFVANARVTTITLALRATEHASAQALLLEHGLANRVHMTEGGNHRQGSVLNALRSLSAEADDLVLVHDAVRPLIDGATIDRTIDAIDRHGAAIVGLPAIDTIKQVHRTADGAIVTATIPRERIVQAQTPQGARYADLRRAFEEADADCFNGTDEASLLERVGITVTVVPGSPANFKITQPGDLELAEFYLNGRS